MTAESLKVHETSIYTKLDAAPPTATLDDLFADCPRLDITVNRLAGHLTSDLQPLKPEVASTRVELIVEILSRDLSRNASVLILERLLEVISLKAFKYDGLETAFLLGEKLVGLIAGEEHALRRVR